MEETTEIEIIDSKPTALDFRKKAEEIDKFKKPNALIKGIYASNIQFNTRDYKVINFLLLLLQETIDDLKKEKPLSKPSPFTRISFDLDLYRELVDNSPNWKQNLWKSLDKIEEVSIDLKDYIDEAKGVYVDIKKVRIIIEPEFDRDLKKQDKDQKCTVSFGQAISYPIYKREAYTHFEYKKMNLLTNKYAMRFYEYLRYKLQEAVNNKLNETDEEIVITEKDFKFLFKKEQISLIKKLGLGQVLKRYVRFETHIVPDLKKLMDFEYGINYEAKTITFKFKKENLERVRTVFYGELDVAAEKFKSLSKTTLIEENETTRTYELKRNFDIEENENMQKFIEAITVVYKDKAILDINETSKFGGDNFRVFSNTFFSEKTKKPISLSKQKKLLLYLFLNKYSIIKIQAQELGAWGIADDNKIFEKFEGREFKKEIMDMEKIISVSAAKNGFKVVYKVRNKEEYKFGFITSLDDLEEMLEPMRPKEKSLFDDLDDDEVETIDYTGDDYQILYDEKNFLD